MTTQIRFNTQVKWAEEALDELQRAATLIREYAANVHGREKLHEAADAIDAAVNHLRTATK